LPPSLKDVALDTFADRLSAAMGFRRMKPAGLARVTGIQARTIGNWQSGHTEPRASEIATLCRALRVSADYLLGRATDICGLTPGTWVVDRALLNRALRNPKDQVLPGFEVPPQPRIVSNRVAARIEKRISAKRRGKS